MLETEDFDTKVIEVDTETFVKDYKFIDGLDDTVESIETKKVYRTIYKGMKVELVEVGTREALEEIEKGLKSFIDSLTRDLKL